MELRGRFCRAKGIFGTMGEQAEKLRESNASWLRANTNDDSIRASHCQILYEYSNEYTYEARMLDGSPTHGRSGARCCYKGGRRQAPPLQRKRQRRRQRREEGCGGPNHAGFRRVALVGQICQGSRAGFAWSMAWGFSRSNCQRDGFSQT